jgi:Fe-S cluster biosynthesis and repair protein YggX
MNPMAEQMIREAFEEENSDFNLIRHALDKDTYADIIVQNRWMGWQQATTFWINENAPIKRYRRSNNT